jgi:hypothetical protein
MQLHMVITDEIKPSMPDDVEIIMDFGQIHVRFSDTDHRFGLNCVVEADTQVIIDWLKPFDGIIKGCGAPQLEQFEIVHIADGAGE